jgi:hypothetical protein
VLGVALMTLECILLVDSSKEVVMSEHATEHEARTDYPVSSASPDLSIVEAKQETEVYPATDFELPDAKFVQEEGSVLEVNDTTRTVYVLRELDQTFPELGYPLGKIREKRLQRVGAFLSQSAVIKNATKQDRPKDYTTPTKVEVKKRTYAEDAVQDVLDELELVQHPTHQILSQIHTKFADQISPEEQRTLRTNVVSAAHEKAFKAAITERLNQDR